MENTANNTQVINNFMIDELLISPLTKIVNGLKSSEYRDCDIQWLDSKLIMFMDLAAETIGIRVKGISVPKRNKKTTLNTVVKADLINKFELLLNYFKTF
jgi:hypothetical protein